MSRRTRNKLTELDRKAKELFDAKPHSYSIKRPGQERIVLAPDWSIQPEHLKDIFREFVKQGKIVSDMVSNYGRVAQR